MTAMRFVLGLAGIISASWGVALLWHWPLTVLVNMALWALVAVVVHDVVFAPLCVAVGWAARRIVPARWWPSVAVAGLCTGVLVVLAIPVFDKPGARPDNATVLDRDYHAGLLISLALVWLAVPTYVLAVRRLPVRQDDVIEQQRTDDVAGEPPSP